MNWACYRRRCEAPQVLSRWLLERTARLVGDPWAQPLRDVAAGTPLPKPCDHKGGAATDMFEARLGPATAAAILSRVYIAAGLAPNDAPAGPLKGIVIAWQEYCAALPAACPAPAATPPTARPSDPSGGLGRHA